MDKNYNLLFSNLVTESSWSFIKPTVIVFFTYTFFFLDGTSFVFFSETGNPSLFVRSKKNYELFEWKYVGDCESKEDKRKEAEEIWKKKKMETPYFCHCYFLFFFTVCVCRQTYFHLISMVSKKFSSTVQWFWFFVNFIQLYNGRLRRMNSNGWINWNGNNFVVVGIIRNQAAQ